MAALAAIGLLSVFAAGDPIPCRGDLVAGLWGKTCPVETPVCCYQENGAPAACCPAGFSCDLKHGDCLAEDGNTRAQQDDLAENASAEADIVLRPEVIILVLGVVLLGVGLLVARLACQELQLHSGNGEGAPTARPILYSQLPSHMIPEDSGSDESVGSEEEAEWLRSVCARRAPCRPVSPAPAAPSTQRDEEGQRRAGAEREDGEEMTAVSPSAAIDPEVGRAASQPLPSEGSSSDAGSQEEILPRPSEADVESGRSPPPTNLPSPQGAADELTCQICFDARADCLLLDCAHLCVCYGCGKRLKVCPFCRKAVRKRKRVKPGP